MNQLSRFLIVGILLISSPFPVAGAELRAGAAKVDITPKMGVSLDGSISKNGPATSVHDRLHARALVLDDGSVRLAIVVVDQCVTGRRWFDAAKETVQAKIGLPTSRMLMAATHTHAAPRTIRIGRDAIDDEYHAWLSDRIAEAVIQADKNLSPASIALTTFDKPELLACRRLLCEPGSVGANPFGVRGERVKSVAGASTAIIKPAGPVDPQFSVLAIKHQDGAPLALLGNFSVHYCGGYQRGAVSADYFGHFATAIETQWSHESAHPPVVGMMSNGTSGNAGAFQNQGKKFRPFEAMEYYGRMLAEQAIESLKAAEFLSDITLAMEKSELQLAVRRPRDGRLQWAKHVLSEPKGKLPHRWSKIYASEAMHLAEYPATTSILLQAIRIGDIGITAAPCEVFAETGLAIKAASPLRKTFNMELANGYAGYLPPRQQHTLGGYETWPARSSFLEVSAEQQIRSRLIELLHQVAQQP